MKHENRDENGARACTEIDIVTRKTRRSATQHYDSRFLGAASTATCLFSWIGRMASPTTVSTTTSTVLVAAAAAAAVVVVVLLMLLLLLSLFFVGDCDDDDAAVAVVVAGLQINLQYSML